MAEYGAVVDRFWLKIGGDNGEIPFMASVSRKQRL